MVIFVDIFFFSRDSNFLSGGVWTSIQGLKPPSGRMWSLSLFLLWGSGLLRNQQHFVDKHICGHLRRVLRVLFFLLSFFLSLPTRFNVVGVRGCYNSLVEYLELPGNLPDTVGGTYIVDELTSEVISHVLIDPWSPREKKVAVGVKNNAQLLKFFKPKVPRLVWKKARQVWLQNSPRKNLRNIIFWKKTTPQMKIPGDNLCFFAFFCCISSKIAKFALR